ncbi:MAG: TonB-dependent receptor [Rhodospirillales bacterium]|nr:TonB-dependent receptor [Rhodospirillales bacterium]
MSIVTRGSGSLTLKNRLSGTVALLALLPVFAAVPALAQSAPQTETIEVTGSRIKNTDAQAANPITVITSEDIAKTSAVTTEDIIRKLPVIDNNGAGVGSSINNGSFGSSTASLRNLGYTRTLILLDGKRLPFTDFGASADAVDLNSIPASMIDHIDVLRDGASSIWGADAVGGVINIILKKHFQGVEIDGSVGETSHGDGLTYSVGSTVGADFDRGNIVINASHDHRDPILQINRDWASNEFKGTPNIGSGPISSRAPGLKGTIPGIGSVYFYGPTNQFVKLSGSQLANPAQASLLRPDVFFSPTGLKFDLTFHPDLTVGLDRNQFAFSTHYDLLPNITMVLDGFYTDRTSQQALNPEPLGNTVTTEKFPNGFNLIPAKLPDGTANPGNPFGVDINVSNTRRFETGLRTQQDESQTYRIHTGLQGTIFSKYDWEVGYAYGQSQTVDRQDNTANFDHLAKLAGVEACGADVAVGCSPANFLGTNSLTPAQASYAFFTSIRNTKETQQYAYGNITGPIYDLPAGPLQFAAGWEYRSETLFDHPDQVAINGDSSVDTFPGSGSDSVASAYAELNIPVLSNLPFVKALTFDTSARYDYYTLFGRSLTWKFGVDYAITDDIRLRGSKSTGFRAPQVKELFGGGFESAESANDPCSTAGGAFAGSGQCLADLAKAGVTGPFVSQLTGQINGIVSGNTALKPETAQQWSVGTVLTPRVVPGLSVSVDYYDVHLRNAIGTIGVQSILNDCYGPTHTHCDLVTPRQAGTGEVVKVFDRELNTGAETTNGIDVDVDYGFDSAMIGVPQVGHIQLTGLAEYLLSDTLTDAFGNVTQQAGSFNFSQYAEPRWKANLGVAVTHDAFTFGVTERYYGGVHIQGASGDAFGQQAPGVFYTDLNVQYKYKNVSLSVGVDNLFDKAPPYLQDGAVNTNTNANYDFTGRFLYLKTSVKF